MRRSEGGVGSCERVRPSRARGSRMAYPGFPSSRRYPQAVEVLARARFDTARDLRKVPGVDLDKQAAVILCASEMLTVTMRRASRGGRSADVVRVLSLGRSGASLVLRLIVTERPVGSEVAAMPCPGADEPESEGRNLEMVDHLSDGWGARRLRWEWGEPVIALWAEFVLPPVTVARGATG